MRITFTNYVRNNKAIERKKNVHFFQSDMPHPQKNRKKLRLHSSEKSEMGRRVAEENGMAVIAHSEIILSIKLIGRLPV